MVWDKEVFEALCDAQAGNLFYGGAMTPDAQVDAVFNGLLTQRSPTSDGAGGYMPGPNDRPFWSLGRGAADGGATDALDPMSVLPTQFPTATPRGIDSALLRGQGAAPSSPGLPPPAPLTGGTQRTLDPQPPDTAPAALTNPYVRYQLLSKIYNNLTTKSNVFAVFCTVGYFQVTDTTTTPPKLGAEMRDTAGRLMRHQMFAIIDRSQMQQFTSNTTGPVAGGVVANASSASPIQITSKNHGLVNNMQVTVTGVQGNTAANGQWTVTVVDNDNFTLGGSTGSGSYTSGGTWSTNPAVLPGGQITAATNAAPIQITSNNHGLTTGQSVFIWGAQGNTAANNTASNPQWTVTVVDANNFTLNTSDGTTSGAYTAGTGTWSTLFNAMSLRGWTLQPGMVLTYEPNAGGGITGASNAAPIVITSNSHGLATGQKVSISGVLGNTAANTTASNPQWAITVIDANTFSLNGSTGSAAYTSGGTWATNNEETVVVQPDPTTPGALLGNFRLPHPLGVSVISRGNPGPPTGYNVSADTGVVQFFAVIY
jgi:hypothetical protein